MYVIEETLQIWLHERQCLTEYVMVGDELRKQLVHRDSPL